MQKVLVRNYNIKRVDVDAIREKKLMFQFFWDNSRCNIVGRVLAKKQAWE
jgi:CTP:phosphocholine cytidylyltransferase-like protein